jgi:hypothetical protein
MHVAGIEKFLAEIWGWSGTNFGGSYAGSGAPLTTGGSAWKF